MGGSFLWEKSQVAWALGRTLSEFEQLSDNDQSWAIAVWRTKAKISAAEAIERHKSTN